MSSVAQRQRKPEPYRNGKNSAPIDHDGEAPYSRAELLRMDRRFVERVERGLERPPDGEGERAA